MAEVSDRLKEVITQLGEKALNSDDLSSNLDTAEASLQSNTAPDIKAVKSSILLVVNLIKDYVSKEYTVIPWASIVLATGAVIYYVLPEDLYKDYLPGGKVDDYLVFTFVLRMIKSDLDDYKNWKATKLTDEHTPSRLVDYLDTKIGSDVSLREAEVDRLAAYYDGDEVVDRYEKACRVLDVIEA